MAARPGISLSVYFYFFCGVGGGGGGRPWDRAVAARGRSSRWPSSACRRWSTGRSRGGGDDAGQSRRRCISGLLAVASCGWPCWRPARGTWRSDLATGWRSREHYHFSVKLVFDRLSVPMAILSFVFSGTIAAFASKYLHREPWIPSVLRAVRPVPARAWRSPRWPGTIGRSSPAGSSSGFPRRSWSRSSRSVPRRRGMGCGSRWTTGYRTRRCCWRRWRCTI